MWRGDDAGLSVLFSQFDRDLKLRVYRRDTVGEAEGGNAACSVAKMSKQQRRLLRHSCEPVL